MSEIFNKGVTPDKVPAPHAPKRGGFRVIKTAETFGAGVIILGGGALAVDKIATGQFPWEPGHQVIVTPGKTPEPIDTESPMVTLPTKTALPTPIIEATPTPETTTTTEPTPYLPAYSMPPESSQKPETTTLEQRLNDWVNGKITVAKDNRFTSGKTPLILNFLDGNLGVLNSNRDLKYADYQGYLLGDEVVDNHLIAYFGLEDIKNNKFFIPVNYGDITKEQYKTGIFKKGDVFDYVGTYISYVIDLKNLNQLFQQDNGKTFLFTLFPDTIFKPPALPTDLADIYEFNAQSGLADKFVRWSFITGNKNSYLNTSTEKNLTEYVINKRVTIFNKDNVLHGGQISIFGDK
jgi:hypothetical protein